MSTLGNFKAVTAALEACIVAAPDHERDALAQALMTWAERFPNSYRNATSDNAPAMLARMVLSIEEASDAHIEIE